MPFFYLRVTCSILITYAFETFEVLINLHIGFYKRKEDKMISMAINISIHWLIIASMIIISHIKTLGSPPISVWTTIHPWWSFENLFKILLGIQKSLILIKTKKRNYKSRNRNWRKFDNLLQNVRKFSKQIKQNHLFRVYN